jgi:uncharacterized protein YcsI (UPF0317 family)
MNTIKSPREIREKIAAGNWRIPTTGLAPAYAQANLVILDSRYAFDFLLFCTRNPKPCPIIEVLEPGRYEPALTAPGADIRKDLPLYRIWKNGVFEMETHDITPRFTDSMVSFLLGCSFSFEGALMSADIPVRNIDQGKNVSMYVTNRQCIPAGVFSAPLVVSMRPIPDHLVIRAVQITSRYVSVHGAPVHIGDPKALGIEDLTKPDFGDPVEIRHGETPVFWACGVTSTLAALSSKPEICITHAPGHMFITDILNETLAAI